MGHPLSSTLGDQVHEKSPVDLTVPTCPTALSAEECAIVRSCTFSIQCVGADDEVGRVKFRNDWEDPPETPSNAGSNVLRDLDGAAGAGGVGEAGVGGEEGAGEGFSQGDVGGVVSGDVVAQGPHAAEERGGREDRDGE